MLALALAGVFILSVYFPALPEMNREIVVSLRLHRGVAALIVGAALATGGVMVQGLFANALASPSILGTTAGASFGVQSILLFGGTTSLGAAATMRLLPIGALAGALLALAVLLFVVRQKPSSLTILLVGFVLSAFFMSLGSLLTALAQENWDVGRAVVFFALGGVSAVTISQLQFAATLLVTGLVMSFFWGRPLDILLSGDTEARSLGLDVGLTQRWVAIWVSVMVAAAVLLAGNIGFVGLIIPNWMRRLFGDRHRLLVVSSALCGALFVLLCDLLVRIIPSTSEIPLGVITGLVGAPFFVHAFLRMRGRAYA